MNRPRRNITIALLASLVIHTALLVFGYLYFNRLSYTPPKEDIMVIDLKNSSPRQIADIMQPKLEERPADAKHLGLYDSKVKEETVAGETVRAPGRPVTRGGEGMEKLKVKEEFSFFKKERKPKKEKEEDDAGFALNKLPEDYYPDYKRGKHTYINVLRHPDVAYFVRLKRVFKLAWDPVSALRRSSIVGQVSRGSIKVVLGISIDAKGELQELFVINSSGMDAYDAEALRAVKASAPFSATPKKLRTPDGMLHVSWTFVVYL